MKLNNQETIELEYFQKIQTQKKYISQLLVEIGKLRAEVDHLNHLLSTKVTEEFLLNHGHLIKGKGRKIRFEYWRMLLKNNEVK